MQINLDRSAHHQFLSMTLLKLFLFFFNPIFVIHEEEILRISIYQRKSQTSKSRNCWAFEISPLRFHLNKNHSSQHRKRHRRRRSFRLKKYFPTRGSTAQPAFLLWTPRQRKSHFKQSSARKLWTQKKKWKKRSRQWGKEKRKDCRIAPMKPLYGFRLARFNIRHFPRLSRQLFLDEKALKFCNGTSLKSDSVWLSWEGKVSQINS